MYDLDWNTCSMADVIERSAVCHAPLFRQQMLSVAQVHARAADHARGADQAWSAALPNDMAGRLRRMAVSLAMGDFEARDLPLAARVQAFSVACKLQCIPGRIARAIASRE